MTKEVKINMLVVIRTLILVTTITIILAVCGQNWKYYLIGGMLGLMCHGLMVKQDARIARFSRLDPEHQTFNPKKSAILWYLLRSTLVIATFVILALLLYKDGADKKTQLISMLIALGGYMTIKVVFLILLIFFRDGKKVVS